METEKVSIYSVLLRFDGINQQQAGSHLWKGELAERHEWAFRDDFVAVETHAARERTTAFSL